MSDHPTYGDELFTWVADEGRAASAAFTRADYHLRAHNAYVLAIHEINRCVDEFVPPLSEMLAGLEEEESRLENVAEIPAALTREASAFRDLNELLSFEDKLARAREIPLRLSSLAGANWFMNSGLSHVGRENMLESLRRAGADATVDLKQRFNFSVRVTLDENGENPEVSANSMNAAGTQFAVKYLSSGGATYAPYVAIAVFAVSAYYIWRDAEVQNRYAEQNRRLREAIERFVSTEALNPVEAFDIWTEALGEASAALKSELDNATALLDAVSAQWKHVFAATAARLDLSGAVLTDAKLRALRLQGGRQDLVELQTLPILLTTSKELAFLDGDLRRQKIALAYRSAEHAAFADFEDYQAALSEGRAVVGYLTENPFFVSLLDRLERSYSTMERAAALVSEVVRERERGLRKDLPFAKIDTALELEPGVEEYVLRELEDATTRKDIGSAAVSQERLLEAPIPPSVYLSLGNGAGAPLSFRVGVGNGTGLYDDALSEDRRVSLELVLGQFTDGGMAGDARRASGQISAFRNNIQERQQIMDRASARLTDSFADWFQRSSVQRDAQARAIGEMDGRAIRLGTYLSVQASEGLRTGVSRFLDNPFQPNIAARTIQDLGRGGTFFTPPSMADSRPIGPEISVIDFRGAIFGENQGGTTGGEAMERALNREKARQTRDVERIRARLAENRRRGRLDPTFENDEQLEDVLRRVEDRLSEARRFASKTGQAVSRFGRRSAMEAAQRLLEEAAGLRRYARNWLDAPPERALGPQEVELQQKLLDSRVAHYRADYTNWRTQSGQPGKPYCNVFIEKVIADVWQGDELANPDVALMKKLKIVNRETGQTLDYLAYANQTIRYIQNDDTHYEYVGEATTQGVLDQAQHLSNIGRAVIYMREGGDDPNGPGGHLALGVPGVLGGPSGNYGRASADFADLRLPNVTSFHTGGTIRVRITLNWAWGDTPRNIQIYVRK